MLWPAEFWATLLSIVEVRQTYAMKQIEFNKFALKSATARCLGPFPRFLHHEDHILFETFHMTGQ